MVIDIETLSRANKLKMLLLLLPRTEKHEKRPQIPPKITYFERIIEKIEVKGY